VLGPDKKPPAFNSDGIALSPDGNYLYFQAVTAKTLYRVKTSALRDNPSGAASSLEKVAQTFPVDGLWMDKKGRLYLSDLTPRRRLTSATERENRNAGNG
jgi:sugar lactone lactonase YvrE